MADLTTDKFDIGFRPNTDEQLVPMAAVKIFNGAMVNKNAAGFAKKAGDVAGETFWGIAMETVDNTGGSAGDVKIRVKQRGRVKMAMGSGAATEADVLKQAYVTDDQDVDLAATTTNDVAVGEIDEFVDADTVYLNLDRRLLA